MSERRYGQGGVSGEDINRRMGARLTRAVYKVPTESGTDHISCGPLKEFENLLAYLRMYAAMHGIAETPPMPSSPQAKINESTLRDISFRNYIVRKTLHSADKTFAELNSVAPELHSDYLRSKLAQSGKTLRHIVELLKTI